MFDVVAIIFGGVIFRTENGSISQKLSHSRQQQNGLDISKTVAKTKYIRNKNHI